MKQILSKYSFIRIASLTLIYTLIILSSLLGAYLVRFDFSAKVVAKILSLEPLWAIVLTVWAVNIFFLYAFGQFRTYLTSFHIPDMVKIFWAYTFSCALILLICFTQFFRVPRGALLILYVSLMLMTFVFRMVLRMYREAEIKDSDIVPHRSRRLLIIGAGDIGTSLAAELLGRRNIGYVPVLFLDDDKGKYGRQILGLEVLKMPDDFSEIKEKYSIDKAVIASVRFSPSRIAELTTALHKANLDVSIVPSYHDLVSGKIKISKMREIDIQDVLGRDPINLDSEKIDAMLQGRVVMVTGAGGSIGTELCRQIAARKVDTLIMLDHCEVQLYRAQQEILSEGYGTPIKAFVGNVADERRMEHIISRYNPSLIFHAAAHKHVPMMEYQPSEALKNNVLGTWTLAQVASRHNVDKFLLISTDKAINPTNVMGASKRMAEKVVQAMQGRDGNKTQFVAVRFGNVLGSSGSVIPTFKKQLAEGGPLTVTHPEVTRYFMTIPEAVGLVLQCGAQAFGGEIFVLDMGEPVKIMDLARQMIRLSGYEPDVDIKIKIIGLRPGEKLYEELQHKNESLIKTDHPRIFGFVSEMATYDEMKSVVEEIKNSADSMSVNNLKDFIHKNIAEYNVQYYD